MAVAPKPSGFKSSSLIIDHTKPGLRPSKRGSAPTMQLGKNDLYRLPVAESMEALERYVEQSGLPELFDEKLMQLAENA